MTKKEWQEAFGETPDAIKRCVAHALATKEEKNVKRKFCGAVALAVVLVMLMTGAALAATRLGLTDFLKLQDSQGVEVSVAPLKWIKQSDWVDAQVRQAACDGVSAHIVVAYTARNAQDALMMDYDALEESVPFSAERAGKRVLTLNSNEFESQPEGEYHETGIQWGYEDASTLVVDYSLYLQPDPLLGAQPAARDAWTLRICPIVYAPDGTATNMTYELTLPVRSATCESYRATGLPVRAGDYMVNAAALTVTDMACYLSVEVMDDAAALDAEAQSLLSGSYWLRVLDEHGETITLLNGGTKVMLGENDESNHESNHYIVRESLSRFTPGDTLTIVPYDSKTGETQAPISLKLEKQG